MKIAMRIRTLRTRHTSPVALLAVAALAWAVSGCPQRIGDRCENSLDCSTEGVRLCDISQTDGYCLIPDCAADDSSCPREAVCTTFRDGDRSFCLLGCTQDADCRAGYVCCSPDPTLGTEILRLPDGGVPRACGSEEELASCGYCIESDGC